VKTCVGEEFQKELFNAAALGWPGVVPGTRGRSRLSFVFTQERNRDPSGPPVEKLVGTGGKMGRDTNTVLP